MATSVRRVWLGTLILIFSTEWVILAIHPRFRQDWALENVLVVVIVAVLAFKRPTLSLTAWTLLFAFGSMHLLGAHYTYAKVPYDEWFQTLAGQKLNTSLGLHRNAYDRLVHFTFGLFLFLPLAETLERAAKLKHFWRYAVPVSVLFSLSGLFELFEWGAAELFGGNLGAAYLGTQGDVWDAQKDMLAALIGAVLAAGLTAAWRRACAARLSSRH